MPDGYLNACMIREWQCICTRPYGLITVNALCGAKVFLGRQGKDAWMPFRLRRAVLGIR